MGARLAVGVVDAEHLGVARVVRRRVLLRVRVAEVLGLAVGLLLRVLRLLPPLLLRVALRGRVVPVRRLLRSLLVLRSMLLRLMLLRGAVVPAASVPESSHVHERTRFRGGPAPSVPTCDIP
ncbi:hypothetical protein GCM10017667_26660 [Streptomyces filamentosus]|uniref:Uncharacterized protein n=1 Tax=Streptomyces filamentosus TaxID=67294 RepID=A0A919BJY9_STRFL|nr:hypothetical protein GCM10017667_26660 [Streptomyces filamentosus]